MKIIYSFNKRGFEADYWIREIAAASTAECEFVPFNHDPYLDPNLYIRAQLLDNLYHAESEALQRMYFDLEQRVRDIGADVLLVDTCPPYHPDYLRKLSTYKVLRIADGPMAAYDRDFAYLHAYDHVLYHSPAYSKDMDIVEKLEYCRAPRADFWPLASFDAMCDPRKTDADILSGRRDIDVVFVGALHVNKMPLIAKVKQALGKRMRLYGLAGIKKNAYFNLKYGFPGWVRPLPFEGYVPTYQRTKIGINIHNRGDYTVGGYRLFDLPANGVMQISDGGAYLASFFEVGDEIIGYSSADDLIDKIKYYLLNHAERERIALNGFRRVRKSYRISTALHNAAAMIFEGMRSRAKVI